MPEISIVRKGDGATINHNLIKVSSTLYRIEFPQPLTAEETYDRYLSKATGKNGEVLPEPLPQITSFTTKDVVVIPPLVLSAVSPLPGEEISHETATLMYSADYALDPATVGPAYTLTNTTSGMQVLASVNVSGKNISVNVDGLLEHSSGYSAVFDPDIIRGLNGEVPTTTYSFSFTTEVVVPPQVFTTPEGYLQIAGTYKDGYTYVGGNGPNDEGFTASFDQNGETVWFESFKISGYCTHIIGMAINDQNLFSYIEVKPDPTIPGPGQLWIYKQTLSGQPVNEWQVNLRATAYSITSSNSAVYLTFTDGQSFYAQRYTELGLQGEVEFGGQVGVHDILYQNEFIYMGGDSSPGGSIFFNQMV